MDQISDEQMPQRISLPVIGNRQITMGQFLSALWKVWLEFINQTLGNKKSN